MATVDKISRRQSAILIGKSPERVKQLIAFLKKYCSYTFGFTPWQKGLTWKQHKMIEALANLFDPQEGVGMNKQEIIEYLAENPLIEDAENDP